ncbi:MAG: rRNA maturation RNAse YbeY [candidate division WOR-3 bacterium]
MKNKMRINIFWQGERLPASLKMKEMQRIAKRLITYLGIKGKELNIIFCSATYIRRLAKKYLRKNYTPACLSFPFWEGEKGFLGEIYLNYHSLNDFSLPHLLEHALKHFLPKGKSKGIGCSKD